MLFDDAMRSKLDKIISSVAETGQGSLSSELLHAVADCLEAAHTAEFPSNLEIRRAIDHKLREWAQSSPTARQLENFHLKTAIELGDVGSFTSSERGSCDGMLCVAPIGLAFSDDPGRAFQLGAEVGALLDADFNSYCAAGVVSLIFALLSDGVPMSEAVRISERFVRPIDSHGEIADCLHAVQSREEWAAYRCSQVAATLHQALAHAVRSEIPDARLDRSTASQSPEGGALAAQLSAICASKSAICSERC